MTHPHSPELESALQLAHSRKASDVYLLPGEPITLRVHGKLERTTGAVLTAEDVERIALAHVGPQRLGRIGRELGRVVVSCGVPGLVSGRMTVARSLGDPTVAVRLLSSRFATAEECRVPEAVLGALNQRAGLVIFSGPSGSGKTTTMLSVLDHINTLRSVHIATVEDPISAIISPKLGLIQQREVGIDVPDIRAGIAACLSQDPDVIMVTELRTAEEVQAAVTAANTGHMVITQLHCHSPEEAVQRLIDAQPAEHAPVFRRELAQALRASVSQVLVKTVSGKGRVPAYGVLIPDGEMRQAIIDGRNLLDRTSPLPHGCQTLADNLSVLVEDGVITEEVARHV